MEKLAGKKAVVIGGARGTGWAIAQALLQESADVLVIDHDANALLAIARSHPQVRTLQADARDEATAIQAFADAPDVVVLSAGAIPPLQPIHEIGWEEFSNNWNIDVKSAFHLAHFALNHPVKSGTQIIFISSGAAFFGSPITGGYAGAKRTQMFLANYAQAESNRLGLGLRFLAIAPWRLMPETGTAEVGIPAYAAYLGISTAQFIARMAAPQTKEDVGEAIVSFAIQAPAAEAGNIFAVSGLGIVPEADINKILVTK